MSGRYRPGVNWLALLAMFAVWLLFVGGVVVGILVPAAIWLWRQIL